METVATDDDGPGRKIDRPLGVAVQEEGSTRRYFRQTLGLYKVSMSLALAVCERARL